MKRIVSNLAFCLLFAVFASQGFGQKTAGDTEFRSFLKNVDEAQLQLQNGKGEPFKAAWSHSDDITLSGGFGGTVEKGWAAVSKRLDWVAENFSKGTNTIERIVTNQNADLAYVIQLEHISFIVPATGKTSTRDYRVTMIFRRERTGWKIVHRQADSQMTKKAPE